MSVFVGPELRSAVEAIYYYNLWVAQPSTVTFDTCSSKLSKTHPSPDAALSCIACGSICYAPSKFKVDLVAPSCTMQIDGPHEFQILCEAKTLSTTQEPHLIAQHDGAYGELRCADSSSDCSAIHCVSNSERRHSTMPRSRTMEFPSQTTSSCPIPLVTSKQRFRLRSRTRVECLVQLSRVSRALCGNFVLTALTHELTLILVTTSIAVPSPRTTTLETRRTAIVRLTIQSIRRKCWALRGRVG